MTGTERMIPIASVELTSQEIDAAVDVLRSGKLRQGKKTEAFEQAFAESVGAREAIAVSSGTAALHVAYLAMIEPGDEVLVPAFSHISTGSMVHYAGGRPVFCDIDSRTFTLSVDDAAKRITPRTKVVAPVHLFGNACAVDALQALAREHGLTILWDAAQAHGTRYRGADVGCLSEAACYSFYPTKNMTTGEGGMITTNDPKLATACRLLRSHGQTAKYYHPSLGLNYRMTDIAAAIGLVQLDLLAERVERRRKNAHELTERLAGVPGITTPLVQEGAEHSFHQYTILLDPTTIGADRDEFAKALNGDGIGTGVHYPRPLHQQPAFERCADPVRLPIAESLTERVLSLPIHPDVGVPEIERIAEAVVRAVDRFGDDR